MTRESMTIRRRDDGYDIEVGRGQVVDTITNAELLTAERPDRLIRERVYAQLKVRRVRRFNLLLKGDE